MAQSLFDLLVMRTWWRYRAGDSPWVFGPYHFFNLFEGAIWLLFAGLVIRRSMAGPRSCLEWGYALAFLCFGLTDFREAYVLESWLIWLKLINLIILMNLRTKVITRYYPQSRLY